jgi:predicted PurR-regulated permease PerM
MSKIRRNVYFMKKGIWLRVLLLILVTLIFVRLFNQTDVLSQLLKVLHQIVAPLFWGCIVAFLLDPPVRKLQRTTRLPRVFCVISAAAGFAVLVLAGLVFLLPGLISGIRDLADQVPAWYNQASIWLADFQLNTTLQQLGLDEILRSRIEGVDEYFHTAISTIVNSTVSVLMSTTSAFFSVLFICLAAIFFLLDKDSILLTSRRLIIALCDERRAAAILHYAAKSKVIFYQFVAGKIIESTILTILGLVGFALIGLPYVVLVSIFVGVTNIIPYIGPVLGAVFALLIALFSADPAKLLYAALMVTFIQLVDNLWCQPKILGGKVGLRPIYVLFAVIVGQAFFGWLGILLAIPVCASLKIILDDYMTYRLKLKGLDDGLNPLPSEGPEPMGEQSK